MHALLLSNLYPSEREPTRGVFNLHRFRSLAMHCPVRVVAPVPWWSRVKQPSRLFGVPHEGQTGLDATFPTYWSLPRLQRAHAGGMALSLRGHLRRLRDEFPFDVILAAWAYPDAAAAAALARELDCPLVTMVLGSDVNEFPRRPSLAPQIRAALRASSRVVAVSGALREKVVDLGADPKRVIVQRNCVDGERFQPRDREEARRRLGFVENGRRRLCYIGNWVPEKGVDVLLEAMGRLRRSDVELLLVGSGPLEDALRARARELGLEEQVRFCGRRPHSEIPDWMAAADALCLPSHREGCPNVVLEALASGRPVVASNVGGVPELLDDRSGVRVPPGDPEALAAGIAEVLDRSWDPQALRASVQFLSWDQYGRTLHRCLTEAVAEHAARGVQRAEAATPAPIRAG